jgi:hypothetical protein
MAEPDLTAADTADKEVARRQEHFHHFGGRAAAFDEAAKHLLMRAGKAFAAGKDDKAVTLRAMAKEIEKMGQDAKTKQKTFLAKDQS